jgi:hypothetical protein
MTPIFGSFDFCPFLFRFQPLAKARVGFPKTRRLALGQSIRLNTLIHHHLSPFTPSHTAQDSLSPTMSLMRTIRNIREGGIKEWFRQMT